MEIQRVCIVLDMELLKQLKNIQGDRILEANRYVPFSKIVRDVIKIGIKNGEKREIANFYNR